MDAFITSREGKIDDFSKIRTFKYNFSESLNKDGEKKENFIRWLKRNWPVQNIEADCFIALWPMEKPETWQYKLISEDELNTSIANTQMISTYLGHFLKHSFKEYYERYLDDNIFIIDKTDFPPFILLKCFSFNVEYFDDGKFYIHLLPTSKIISSKSDIKYFKELKSGSGDHSPSDEMTVNLIDCGNHRRQKIDLCDREYISQIEKFLNNKRGDAVATFDYHFISNYSYQIFRGITEKTKKDLTESINFLKPISEKIILPDFITLNPKPFLKISVSSIANKNNLLIGNNKIVKEQSAAYYNGIFQPVNNKIIQPVVVNGATNYADLFREKINIFNGVGANLKVESCIDLSADEDKNIALLGNLKKQYGDDLLLPIFTEHKLSNDFLGTLKNLRIRWKPYMGAGDDYSMSNFAVSCLERLGGTLNIIQNTYEPETTYFAGIDLGHTTYGRERFSNLAAAFFDNRGRLIYTRVSKKNPINEVIMPETIGDLLRNFSIFLKRNSMPKPEKLIFHRDGRLHSTEVKTFCEQTKKCLAVDNIDIVEIIKSGYPIIAGYDNKKYVNLDSGYFWAPKDKKYALLITNIQAKEKNSILSPIIIKHKFGTTDFLHIIEQIYWFTKVYTNNLYNSTRLPATTVKANSLARTGNKMYYASYLA